MTDPTPGGWLAAVCAADLPADTARVAAALAGWPDPDLAVRTGPTYAHLADRTGLDVPTVRREVTRPDCLAEVAAPRGRRLDVRCRPCRAEVDRRPDRRPRRQPLQREVCQ